MSRSSARRSSSFSGIRVSISWTASTLTIDDYTQPDPIPAAMLAGLMQRRVSFALSPADADAGERAVDEPADDRVVASSADADCATRRADRVR